MLPTGLVEQRNVPVGGITLLANGKYILQGDTIIDGAEIDVASAFSEAPAAGSVFLFQNDDIQSQQFRVVSVAETEDGIYGVSAVAYNSTIYDAVESDVELTNRDISNLSLIPNPVDSVSVEEFLYEEGQQRACWCVGQLEP